MRLLAITTGVVLVASFSSCVVVPTSYQPLLDPPIISSASYPIGTENCSLSHKVLIAPVSLCGIVRGRPNRCVAATLKVQFLGTKAFFYDNESANTGIAFEFDRAVDLITDPQEDKRWKVAPRAGLEGTAIAIGNRQGDLTKMGWKSSAVDVRTKQLMAVSGQSMTIRTDSCSNSCQVLEFSSYMNNRRSQDRVDEHLARQTCHIN
jgi:hypothetical protein